MYLTKLPRLTQPGHPSSCTRNTGDGYGYYWGRNDFFCI